MTKRIIFLGMVCGLLAGSTGCGLVRCLLCPGAPYDGACGAAMSGPDCGVACGPECEDGCGVPAPAVCEPACGPEPVAACGPAQAPCGPLSWIGCLLGGVCGAGGGCGSCGGCGETYYGDCCGDPSDACNPCDQWGNYTGGSMGGYGGGYIAGTAGQVTRVEPAPEVARRPAASRR